MANQQIKRLLRRRPELDEAEFELLQSKVLARLRGAPDGGDATVEEEPAGSEVDATAAGAIGDEDMTSLTPIDERATNGHLLPGRVTTYELPEHVVGVMAEPGDAAWESVEPLPGPMPESRELVAVMARAEPDPAQQVPPESVMVTAKPRRPKATRTAKARPRRCTSAPEAEITAPWAEIIAPEAEIAGSLGIATEPEATAPEAVAAEPETTTTEATAPAPEMTAPVAAGPEPAIAAPEAAVPDAQTAAPEVIVATPKWLAKATDAAKARPGNRTTTPGWEMAAREPRIAPSPATERELETPEPETVNAEPEGAESAAVAAEPALLAPSATRGPRLAKAARAAKARLRRRTPEPAAIAPEPEAPEPGAIAPEPEPKAPEPEVIAAAREAPEPVVVESSPVDAPTRSALDASTSAKPAARPRRPVVSSPPRERVAAASHAASAPYCPYCALLLDPPPEANRRCPRCRERIIVKRVDGRTIYLTEASVSVFDAERRRMASAGRWTRERQRWLKVATAVGAPAERVARLEAAPLSEELVRAAHALYSTTVDRSFKTAKRERRWDDASRIMREHAQVLFRLAGASIPPPEESVRAHQQAAAAALHGIAEMAREAELVGARCCSTCAADHGQTFRIATELRTPRLPHTACPKGLCRCDWYLAVRDQTMVRRHLRRRARADVPIAGGSR